jgi:hypothetical protein
VERFGPDAAWRWSRGSMLIRHRGKKVMVINKFDILTDPGDREQVIDFVREHAGELLGQAPETSALSARQAMAGPPGQ